MPVFMMRTTGYSGLNVDQQGVLKILHEWVDLGEGREYIENPGQNWYVFDDARYSLDDVAVVAKILQFFVQFDPGEGTREEIRAAAYVFAVSKGAVFPADITYATDDPWQETLDANGVFPEVKMSLAVPEEWVPIANE